MQDYMVLIVDIKKSSSIQRGKINLIVSKINDTLLFLKSNPLVHISGFTTGDEFEIVLMHPRGLYNIIHLIRHFLDIEYRIGIGLGEIENPTIGSINKMWGSAFSRAREAINMAKKRSVEVYFITYDNKFNNSINTILDLLYFLREKMTVNQKSIFDKFNYYQNYENLKYQSEFAEKINVSNAMISKTLKIIGYEQIINGEKLVESMLSEFFERLVPV